MHGFLDAPLRRTWAVGLAGVLAVSSLAISARPGPSPYKLLGVRPGASADVIKGAYKRLALLYHPDRNGGASSAEAQRKFQEIREAFEQLTSCCRVEGTAFSGARLTEKEVFLTAAPGWTPGKETQVTVDRKSVV